MSGRVSETAGPNAARVLVAMLLSLGATPVGAVDDQILPSAHVAVASLESAPVTQEPSRPRQEIRLEVIVDRVPLGSNRLTIYATDALTKAPITIGLRGVELISFRQVCRLQDDTRFACGARAKVAISNLLANSTMTCLMRHGGGPMEAESCWIGDTDVADWVIGAGFGRPTENSGRLIFANEARERRLGLWADAYANLSFPLQAEGCLDRRGKPTRRSPPRAAASAC